MRYLSLTVLYSSTQTIFIVFAVAYSAMSLNQLISTYVCCNVLFGVFSLWLIREQLIIPKKFNDLKDLIHVSAPVGLICIAIAASPIIERALVSSLSGHEALGEYGFATRFTLILWVVYTAFSNAWGPFAIRIYTRTSSIKTFNLILKILAVCACIFPFILVWFGSILVNYFDLYAYEGAVELIFPLALAVGVHAITSMLEFGIFISKNNFPRILVVLTSIIVLVLSVIFFARNYSALGVAWCVLVAATTRLLLTHVFSQRNYSMRWKITFLVIILGQAVLLGINQQLIHKVGEQSISGISVLAHTSIISMTAYFFLTKIDRSMMKLWIKRLQKNILVSCIAHKLIRRRV